MGHVNYLRTLVACVIVCCAASAGAAEITSFDLVRESSDPIHARMPYLPSTSLRVGDRLELSSDGGSDFSLTVSRARRSQLGNQIIHASTDLGGRSVLVVSNGGALLGSISEQGEKYLVFTSSDGVRNVSREDYPLYERKIDRGGRAFHEVMPIQEIESELRAAEPTVMTSRVMSAEQSSEVIYPSYSTGTATVTVLFYYDDSMSDAAATIDFITQIANDAYVDSGAEVQIEIVGTKAVDVDDDAAHSDLKSAMDDGAAPFADIEADRDFFSADLVYLLRDTESPEGEDPCGIASLGVIKQRHFRVAYTGLVQWLPAGNGGNYYCSDLTFAHEVGHSLGAAHDRGDTTEDGELKFGAYSYSYGSSVAGGFRTVMGVTDSESPRVALFSSPDLNCNGYPCGKGALDADSADNVSSFLSTGKLVASNAGDFTFESLSSYATRGQERECTTSDDTDGYFRGIYLSNQSAFPIEVVSSHGITPDGDHSVAEHDAGEFIVEPGTTVGWGFCREVGQDPVLGTSYTRAFHRYLHPQTGQVVESTIHEWDDDYDGEYRKVRAASGEGGVVSGNPAQSIRVGSSQTFEFLPNTGYVIASIYSNCSGQRNGASFTVDVGQDDCIVQATFQQLVEERELRLSLETPVQGRTYTGIATVRGWAIADEGIVKVDVYIDDSFFQSAPYGGEREDVGGAFPGVEGSSYSGFALAYNYSLLSRGEHTIRAEAITQDGRTISRTKSFAVTNFHKPFIGPQDPVSLSSASCSVADSEISVFDAYIDGQAYDLTLEWRSADQDFQIFDIR